VHNWNKLPLDFYDRSDVVTIAGDLLGKILVSRFNNAITAVRITETEAYAGVTDRASHAYGGRRTRRTEIMFGQPGTAYVYLCYGIHHLFNVVTNKLDIPHAVLVRSGEPLTGIKTMLKRSGKEKADHALTRGPGNLSRALGITTHHTGLHLLDDLLFIASDEYPVKKSDIIATPRIGVAYAGVDAALLYRFYLKDNSYVSQLTNKLPKQLKH
jgi:DNA-3-methyladenine glycosylase